MANENIPLDSILLLKEWGYDVLSVSTDTPSITDSEILQIAISENRLIVTFDRDYGELIFRQGYRPAAGVIYLRVEPVSPTYPAELVRDLIESGKFQFNDALTVVHEHQVRQKKYG